MQNSIFYCIRPHKVLEINMVKVRQYLFLGLALIPMLLGLVHNFSQCFDNQSVETISHISDYNTENPSSDCHKNDDCADCCSLTHTKVIVSNSTIVVTVPVYNISSSFHYSFNPKTIILPTPEKPPRV